jgi:hypothetical protein
MYRAVVVTTLVLLMLAVAGVSVAQEDRIFAGESNSDSPPESTEPTTPERTSLEATAPQDTTTSQPPDAPTETDDRRNTPEPTVVTQPTVVAEPTVGEPERSAAVPARQEPPTPGTNGVDAPGNGVEGVGRAPEVGNPRADVRPHGNGEPEVPGNEVVPGRGVGRQKAILCHKGTKTLTVGAPALAAHLRHGDGLGACP